MGYTAIVDYGVGNLFSLLCSLKFIGADARVTCDAEEIRAAEGIILPGVGAFADARAKLAATGLEPVLKEQADAGKPFLGICLGMQMLFEKSYEYGEHEGLGFMKGEVVPFDLPKGMKVPHMGWNNVSFRRGGREGLLDGISDDDQFYFVHSYYVDTPDDDIILGTTEYGGQKFASAIAKGRLVATQFHPEKSQQKGLSLYKNFIRSAR